jgi:Type II secretion system (T2SS), protein E, N-terminal domain
VSTPLRERPDAPLGTLIFRAGLLPAETIENALEEGVKTGKRLGEILTERGLISEVDLARLLAGQKGLDFVTLREQIVDPAAAALFSEEQAKLFRALPYSFEDGTPVVAIADPTDEVLLRNIREGLGREDVKFVVSTRGELAEISGDVYSRSLQAATPAPEPTTAEPTPEPEAAVEPEPVVEEPVPAPAPEAEAAVEVGWPQVSPDPTPGPEPAPVAHEPEPAPEPALEPAPTPEAPAVPYTNGVVPPDTAPLLQTPAAAPPAPELAAPEHVAPSAPEPVAEVPEPALQVPAPEPPVQAEQPAPVEPAPAPQPLQVSEPAPEPAPEPAATVEPLRVPEPAPVTVTEPLPASEPVASPEPAPLAEPTPPPAPYPPAATQPAPEPAPVVPEPVEPAAPVTEPGATLWRVLIRLTNGERVDAGDFPDLEAAKQHAKSLMGQVADADQGDWPFVSGRFLKPDTIVSVDIAEHDGDGPAD